VHRRGFWRPGAALLLMKMLFVFHNAFIYHVACILTYFGYIPKSFVEWSSVSDKSGGCRERALAHTHPSLDNFLKIILIDGL
jgi:hypothetical protein